MKVDAPVEATGLHVGDRDAHPITASGGSTVWNISFGEVAGKAGWLFVPGIAAGWWSSRKRHLGALDTVIGAIEAKSCDACKRCVAARANPVVNQRVAVVTTRMKNGG